MNEFAQVFMEIQTLGDCSGLTGVLAKEGKNLAFRRLGLGEEPPWQVRRRCQRGGVPVSVSDPEEGG